MQGTPYFPMYGSNSTIVNVGRTGLGDVMTDTVANDRCAYWETAPYATG